MRTNLRSPIWRYFTCRYSWNCISGLPVRSRKIPTCISYQQENVERPNEGSLNVTFIDYRLLQYLKIPFSRGRLYNFPSYFGDLLLNKD